MSQPELVEHARTHRHYSITRTEREVELLSADGQTFLRMDQRELSDEFHALRQTPQEAPAPKAAPEDVQDFGRAFNGSRRQRRAS